MKRGRKPGPSTWSKMRINEVKDFMASGKQYAVYDHQFDLDLERIQHSIRLGLDKVINNYYPCPVTVSQIGDKTYLVRNDLPNEH